MPLVWLEWLTLKLLRIPSVGNDIEQQQKIRLSYIAIGMPIGTTI